jgi:hypothetical protein
MTISLSTEKERKELEAKESKRYNRSPFYNSLTVLSVRTYFLLPLLRPKLERLPSHVKTYAAATKPNGKKFRRDRDLSMSIDKFEDGMLTLTFNPLQYNSLCYQASIQP